MTDAIGQDALQNLLELAYVQHRRSVLHAHTCSVCRCLRPCCVSGCQYRATDQEREWVCSTCQDTPSSCHSA